MNAKIQTSVKAAVNGSSAEFPRRIVVLGNNVCAWMSATMLARNMEGLNTQITVVSGDHDDRTPFRATWTSATLSAFVSSLGVDEQDMMRCCQGTYRMATRYSNWTTDGKEFVLPVGDDKKQFGGRSLYDNWQIQLAHGSPIGSLSRLIPQTSAAGTGRSPHSFSGNSPLSEPSQYGYHVDFIRLSDWFKAIALRSGVNELDEKTLKLITETNGRTTSVRFASKRTVPVDLVLDCRQKTRQHQENTKDWIDLSNRFQSDRVVRQVFAASRQVPSLTDVHGMEHGWANLIPLHGEVELQYAFSSSMLSDEEALEELRAFASNNLQEELTDRRSPNSCELIHGRCAEFWKHNVVQMGPAAFEFEPLGVTSIHVAAAQIELLLDLLGGCASNAANSIEYNDRIGSIVDETIDFVQLHHVLRGSSSEQYLSSALEQKLKVYDAIGTLPVCHTESPSPLHWALLLTGAGRMPVSSSWDMRQANDADVERQLRTILSFNEAAVRELPRHEEILDWIHSAPLPLEAG